MCSKVKDFLTDTEFIDYILNETPKLVSYWESYFGDHSNELADAAEAKDVLLAEPDVLSEISAEECADLKIRIMETIKGSII